MSKNISIYHGSNKIISTPTFGAGNPRNDYGLGFYCTESIELAKEWACTDDGGGYASQYELICDNLKVMNLSDDNYNILNWLALLLDNRTFRLSNDIAKEGTIFLIDEFLPDISTFDVIIGYRADDSYFSFANAFLNNTLSLQQLGMAMYLGNLGEQVVLKTKKSFDNLKYVKSEYADGNIYFPKRDTRDYNARKSLKREREKTRVIDSVYLIDILRGGWTNDDPRLQRNLSK